ncbi:MAG: hypothetical protein PVG59_04380 [Desulfobacterales bacterium]
MKAQNRERQRNGKHRWGLANRSDMAGISVSPFLVRDAIKQYHPYKKEILIVVRTLNSIGAKRNIIAAALGLQGWKTFYGDSEWTENDVSNLLKEFRAPKTKTNNMFWLHDKASLFKKFRKLI